MDLSSMTNLVFFTGVLGSRRSGIAQQNKLILDFAQQHLLQWTQHHKNNDVFLAEYKSP